MAKRANATKKTKKDNSEAIELNPGVSAAGRWLVYRADSLQTLAINADQLDVTENGTLIFFVGGSNEPPQAVVAGDRYLHCAKSTDSR
jgi:Tol biopolymer transport system component